MKKNLLVIHEQELHRRQHRLADALRQKHFDAAVIFSPESIFYLTNLELYPTERPVVLIVTSDSATSVLVPYLDYEYAKSKDTVIGELCSYRDYPGTKHPMLFVSDILSKMSLSHGRICTDQDGYSPYYGYIGPSLCEVCREAEIIKDASIVAEIKAIKSEFDLSVIREGVVWSEIAHRKLQSMTRPGITDTEAGKIASNVTTGEMMSSLGEIPANDGLKPFGVTAEYRGQIGAASYFPHIDRRNTVIKENQHLVSAVWTDLQGYNCELERVLFTGKPAEAVKNFYCHVCEAQEIAFSMLRPGNRCSDVDRAVMQYYQKHDLLRFWRHHTGHSLGFAVHEAPFLDIGDHTELRPGMVFSLEPGIYVKDVGGFRVSDTVLVTETGAEYLTTYTKEIDRLQCGE